MIDTSMVIVLMNLSFLSVMNAVLRYAGTLELPCALSFAEVRIKDIFDDMMHPKYLRKHSLSSHLCYIRFDPLMNKNFGVLPPLESLNESQNEGRALGISHPDSEVLHGTRARFIVLLKEAADYYINNSTNQPPFTPSASTNSANSCYTSCTDCTSPLSNC